MKVSDGKKKVRSAEKAPKVMWKKEEEKVEKSNGE